MTRATTSKTGFMFLRYLAASVVSLVIDYSVLLLLARRAGLSDPAAAAVGYIVGALVHYAISRRYVFPEGWLNRRRLVEFGGFLASGVAGLVLTVAVVYAGSNLLGLSLSLSKATAVAISFVATYLIRRSVVFKSPIAPTSQA